MIRVRRRLVAALPSQFRVFSLRIAFSCLGEKILTDAMPRIRKHLLLWLVMLLVPVFPKVSNHFMNLICGWGNGDPCISCTFRMTGRNV